MVSLRILNERKHMELTPLKVQEVSNKKTGEIKKNMVALGNFANYGNVEPATVTIGLTDEQFTYFQTKVGQKLEVDVIVPLPQFPMTISPSYKLK